jgi:type IV secretory pathway TraG/TraD family ATPase VirD4
MENKENWKYTQVLRNEFSLLVKAPFGFLLDSDRPTIDLRDVFDQNLVVYFSLNMQSYPKQAQRIGKLITADINTLSGLIESNQKRKEKKPLCVYIDEFQAFGTENFLNALARGRSSGLCITIAHQSIGDLRAISPEFAQQVIDLTNTKIFLRVNDPETASLFSDSLGTYETVEVTRQIQLDGTPDPRSKLMGSQKKIERYRIHPSEIKDLQTGEAVIKSLRGHGKVSLCPYFLDMEESDGGLPVRRKDRTDNPPDGV